MTSRQINVEIGARARLLREAAGMSGTAIAAAASTGDYVLSQTNYSRLERGALKWSPTHLENVARILGVSPCHLLTGEAGAMQVSSDEEMLVLAWRRGGPAGLMGWLATQLPGKQE